MSDYEHPTDNIDHDLPDRIEVGFAGDALRSLRTEAEVTGQDVNSVVSKAISMHIWMSERMAEGYSFFVVTPTGEKGTFDFQEGRGGENVDLDPLSDS